MGESITDPGLLKDFQGGSAADFLVDDGKGGFTFTPERQALHKEILDKLLEGYTPAKGRPRFNVMGGGPASGKSVMEKSTPEISEGAVLVNPDVIKEMLPEAYHSGETTPSGVKVMDAPFVHEESSYLAKKLQSEAISRGISVTLDGTGNSKPEKLRGKLREARDAGFEVNAYYVTVDVGTALERSRARGVKTGRSVPDFVIANTHASVSNTFDAVKDEFDTVKLYDTTGATPGNAFLVGSKEPGGRFKVADEERWKAFVDKGKVPPMDKDGKISLSGDSEDVPKPEVGGGDAVPESGEGDSSLEAGTMSTILAFYLNGGKKEDSRFKDDPGFAEFWDSMVADVEKMKEENPSIQFLVPNEIPEWEDPFAYEDSDEDSDEDSVSLAAISVLKGMLQGRRRNG